MGSEGVTSTTSELVTEATSTSVPVVVDTTTSGVVELTTTVAGITTQIVDLETTGVMTSTTAPVSTTELLETTASNIETTAEVLATTAASTTSEVISSVTTTTPKPAVETTTESTEDKLCELPMDVENVYGSQISSVPTISASSNQPEDIANKPWSPSTEDLATDNDAWIQIEFEQPVYIFGLTVKGAGEDTGKFVSKVKVDYKLETSSDEPSEEFSPISSENDDDTFTANVDDSQMSSIYFPDKQPVLVTSIRVHPVEWTGDEPAIRLHCWVATRPLKQQLKSR